MFKLIERLQMKKYADVKRQKGQCCKNCRLSGSEGTQCYSGTHIMNQYKQENPDCEITPYDNKISTTPDDWCHMYVIERRKSNLPVNVERRKDKFYG